MTGGACRNIGFGNAVLKDLLSSGHKFPWSIAEGSGIESSKFPGQCRSHRRTQNTRHVEHNVVSTPVFKIGSQLILEILSLLSCNSRYRIVSVIALPQCSMAVLTIRNLGLESALRSAGRVRARRAARCQERDRQNGQRPCQLYAGDLHRPVGWSFVWWRRLG